MFYDLNLIADVFSSRIEIETLLTQNTKWDGVGFRATSNKGLGYCLVEFSGGIKKNCSQDKARGDEKKIEKGTVNFIEYTQYKKRALY